MYIHFLQNMDPYTVVSEFYGKLSGPGSFAGFSKIRYALREAGYKISDLDIKNALKKIENYEKFRMKYRSTLPKHVSKRHVHISSPDLWFYGDSMYLPRKGWRGNQFFIQVWIDGFSKRLFARPLTRLTADNSVKVFKEIIEQENDGKYPDRCYVDRGSEWMGAFSAFLKEKSVRQIFTTAVQQNKGVLLNYITLF